MSLRKEFPDFDPATLPTIPASFTDASWHNDACPSFTNEAAGLEIYVDYLDPVRRECGPDMPRFSLLRRLPNGDAETVVSSDEWGDVLNAIKRSQS